MTPTELSKLIPDEVVEAAARAVYEEWCRFHDVADTSMPWAEVESDEREACLAEARAAIAAGLAAWPMAEMPHVENAPAFIILPLTQEASDE